MKKILLLSIGILCFFVGCNNQTDSSYIDDSTPISLFQSNADYEVPNNLNNLENASDYIVKVNAIHDIGDDEIDGQVFGSKKKVEVIESYKGEFNDDEIIIIEPAHVEDGEYVATESYIKMMNGEEYILFLIDGDNFNEYGVSALGYGKYSLDRNTKLSSITNFNTFSDLEEFDFVSNDENEIALYEKIKKEVLKEYK